MELPTGSPKHPTIVAEDWVGGKDLIWVSETWTQEKAMMSFLEIFSHASSCFFICLSLQKYFFLTLLFLFSEISQNAILSLFCQDPVTRDYDYDSQSKFYTHGDSALTWSISENADSMPSVCVIFPLLIYFTNALVQIYLSSSHAYKAVPVTSCKWRHHDTEEKH